MPSYKTDNIIDYRKTCTREGKYRLILNHAIYSFLKSNTFLKGHYLPNRKFLLPVKTIRYN